MKVRIFKKEAKKLNNVEKLNKILTNSLYIVCLLHSISFNSKENFESNNISNFWKLHSMFRLKALEMTIPMVYHKYIYHD